METESGAKIAIRGKGSVKEGKGRSDAAHTSNQEEDLHCLIMADTEEKVNKAKKLIHNVIETVSIIPPPYYNSAHKCRLRPFPKVRMSSSEINSVNLPRSMAPCVTTRIKLVRTVDRLAIANTIVLNSATLLPTSFVDNAATPVTLPRIVTIDLRGATGAMDPPVLVLLDVSVKATQLIANSRYVQASPVEVQADGNHLVGIHARTW